jgi:hypothetical protein
MTPVQAALQAHTHRTKLTDHYISILKCLLTANDGKFDPEALGGALRLLTLTPEGYKLFQALQEMTGIIEPIA